MRSGYKYNRVACVSESPPAKITRPVLSGVVARKRLFDLLDATRVQPITWIVASPGSGKTTLIASYLEMLEAKPLWYQIDPTDDDVASFFDCFGLAAGAFGSQGREPLPQLREEQRDELASFTHIFFRELFARLPQPGVVVLDDYQRLDTAARTHEAIQQGFDEIPANVRVFVISREEPHGAFARLRASGRIALLSGEELRLTESETAELIAARVSTVAAPELLAQNLHRRTQGWAAGIVLLTESAVAVSGEPVCEVALAHDHVVFDYFANEIFRHRSSVEQEILIKTAFPKKITEHLARQVTGRDECGMLLNDLARRGYFTTRRAAGSYEYHPLFRAFLVNRAMETFGKVELRELKAHSARLMVEMGDVEAAIELLQQEMLWNEAGDLVLHHSRSYLEQGKGQTLQTIIDRFPSDLREENPWSLYLQGACQLGTAPAEARTLFERAFKQFEMCPDTSALYHTWIGIIQSYVIECHNYTPMRPWIDRYATLAQGRSQPDADSLSFSLFTYLDALRFTRPDHPDFISIGSRAEEVFRREPDARRKVLQAIPLLAYYSWRGELGRMQELLETLEPVTHNCVLPPVELIAWKLMRTIYHYCTGSLDECMQAVNEGLALAESAELHGLDGMLLLFGICGQVRVGALDAARSLMQLKHARAEQSQMAKPFYNIYNSLFSLQEGNAVRALDSAQRARQISTEGSFVYAMMSSMLCEACALAQLERLDEAFAVLEQTYAVSRRSSSKLFDCYCLHVRAHLLRLKGDREGALDALRSSLDLGHETGVCMSMWCRREDMAALYAMALNAGIQRDYVSTMIVKMRLQPPPHLFSEKWPWSLRVYTLGRFAVVKNGEPLYFGGKAHHKPLELLRMLVSFGGRNVSGAAIAGALWPDSDGDMARTALETTLHRLRRLIGDKCIITHMGQLSLNAEDCWLDSWAFEHLTDRLEAVTPTNIAPRRLVELYQGAFLPNDESARAVAQRERLRSKFLRGIVHYGKQYEGLEQWHEALSLYQQGIEADPTAEELYRLLMQCYRQLGRFAEAVAAYQRCQRVLAAELNVEPSRDSQQLHRAISHELPQPMRRG